MRAYPTTGASASYHWSASCSHLQPPAFPYLGACMCINVFVAVMHFLFCEVVYLLPVSKCVLLLGSQSYKDNR